MGEIALSRAAEIFRGADQNYFFRRADHYHAYSDLFLRFTEVLTQELCGACESAARGASVPPVIHDFLNLIMCEKPDAVGISMIFSQQLPVGALLGKLLKQKGQRVILGGSCFTDAAENFLKWHPESGDLIVAGEGEEGLRQYLLSPDSPEKIPGAVFLKGGEVQRVEPSIGKDVDCFGSPDFSDLNLKRYFSPEPVIPLLLSRGCYWRRCTFCVHYRSAGLTYRMHSIPFVIEMLQRHIRQGVRNFAFIDEMISPNHFERLARAIKEAQLNISYYALTKPVKQFTPERLSLMAESGCKYLLWGVESASQRVLDLMDKGTKVEDVSGVLRAAHAAGIANHVYIICGFPTETAGEFIQTIRFLEEHKDCIYCVHRGTFTLESESPIFADPARFGITRVWLKKDDHVGGRWGYECASGMTSEQVKQVFQSALPFLRVFNPFSQRLGNFRDHALLIYKHLGSSLRPDARVFPTISYPDS